MAKLHKKKHVWNWEWKLRIWEIKLITLYTPVMTQFFFIAPFWTFSVSVVLLSWVMEFNIRFFFFFPSAGVIWSCTRVAGHLTTYTKSLRQYLRKCSFLTGWGRVISKENGKEHGRVDRGMKCTGSNERRGKVGMVRWLAKRLEVGMSQLLWQIMCDLGQITSCGECCDVLPRFSLQDWRTHFLHCWE